MAIIDNMVNKEMWELHVYKSGMSLCSYDDVMKRDFTSIRKVLTAYLSNKRGYYKYLRGEWPLMPEQQRYIEEVFASHGYDGKVIYDRMEDVFMLENVVY